MNIVATKKDRRELPALQTFLGGNKAQTPADQVTVLHIIANQYGLKVRTTKRPDTHE